MALLTIGGVPLPNPSEYSVKRSDLDSENTTRNESGNLQRERIRGGVYSIDVTWKVKKGQYKTVVDALSSPKFTVLFFDPNSATTKTASMYAGDRTGKLSQYIDESAPEDSVWELSTTLIEY